MFAAIQFDSFAEFLHMGGYAFNVWTVYLLFVVFIMVNLLAPMYRRKQIMRDLRRRAVVQEELAKRTSGSAGPLSGNNGG